jgi:hypothetical protein
MELLFFHIYFSFFAYLFVLINQMNHCTNHIFQVNHVYQATMPGIYFSINDK